MQPSALKRVCLVLVLFAIASNIARAGSATLKWQPSPSSDVVGYRIYYGNRSFESSVVVANETTTAQIDGLIGAQLTISSPLPLIGPELKARPQTKFFSPFQ